MAYFAKYLNELHLSPKPVTMKITVMVVLLSLLEVTARKHREPRAHAPCYDCEFLHIMQRDHGFHDNQVCYCNSQ